MPTQAEVFRQAAREIEVRGWCQGALEMEDGSVCAEGAINKAADRLKLNMEGTLPHRCAIEDYIFNKYGSLTTLVGWNDAPGRHPHEVIDLLDETADWLEGNYV